MINRTWAVMVNTFRETIRNRILLNILIFAVGLILLSLIVGDWSLGEQVRVIKDFGLSAMSVFGLLIAIFIGIRLMVQEQEQRTIYMIASKPVKRWQILTGKYLGLGMTLGINVVLMTGALWFAEYIMEGTIDTGLLAAVILIYIEILLIVAFALFFSTFASPTLSAVFTLTIFIAGYLNSFLYEYVRVHPDRGFHWLLKIIHYILPDLEKLNLKMEVVRHIGRQPHDVLYGGLYGIFYIILVVFITSIIFSKKDLK